MNETQVFDAARKQEDQLIARNKNNKFEHVVRMWGAATKNPLFIGRYGRPNEGDDVYARWFDTEAEAVAFRAEVTNYLKLLNTKSLVFSLNSGTLVRKRTVAVVTLTYKGKDYVVKRDYGYGYEMHNAISDWEENNTSCDCNRVPMIARQHPGAGADDDALQIGESSTCVGSGRAVVKDFRFELVA